MKMIIEVEGTDKEGLLEEFYHQVSIRLNYFGLTISRKIIKPQASELPLRTGICPKNHGIARQLSSDGYCQDCQDYPYGKGKIRP